MSETGHARKDERTCSREHTGGIRGGSKMEGVGTSVLTPHPAAEGPGHCSSDCCRDGQTGHSTVKLRNLAVEVGGNLTVNAGSVLARCPDSGSEPDADRKDPHGDAPSDQQPLEADCIDRTPLPLLPTPTSPSSQTLNSSAGSMELSPFPTPTKAGESDEGTSDLTLVLQQPSCGTGQFLPARNIPHVSGQNSEGTSMPSLAALTWPKVRADAPPISCPGIEPNPSLRGSVLEGQIGIPQYRTEHDSPAEAGPAIFPNETLSGKVPTFVLESKSPILPSKSPNNGASGGDSAPHFPYSSGNEGQNSGLPESTDASAAFIPTENESGMVPPSVHARLSVPPAPEFHSPGPVRAKSEFNSLSDAALPIGSGVSSGKVRDSGPKEDAAFEKSGGLRVCPLSPAPSYDLAGQTSDNSCPGFPPEETEAQKLADSDQDHSGNKVVPKLDHMTHKQADSPPHEEEELPVVTPPAPESRLRAC